MQDNDPTNRPEETDTASGPDTSDTQKTVDAQAIESPQSQLLNAIESDAQPDPQPTATGPAVDQPLVRANDFVARPAEPSHKGVVIGIAVAILAILVAIGGFVYWHSAVRVADAEYEKADALISAMIDSTNGIEAARKSLRKVPSGGSSSATVTTASMKLAQSTLDDIPDMLVEIESARAKSAEYLANQQALSRLLVITDDEVVNPAYTARKKVIEDYGKSADTYYRTAHVFTTMMDRCFAGGALTDFSQLESIEDYDRQVKPCKEYLAQHTTTPSAEFSREAYEPMRDVMLLMITNFRILLMNPPSSAAYKQAESKLSGINKTIDRLDSTVKDRIQPTQNPKTHLEALKKKIVERKSAFIR